MQVLFLDAAASRMPAGPADVMHYLRDLAPDADAAAFRDTMLWRLTVTHSPLTTAFAAYKMVVNVVL